MIYTNIENIKIKKEVKSYLKLSDNFKYWIDNTTFNLYTKRTKSELKTSEILNKLNIRFEPQVFFFDSLSKKTYFVDFFLYDKNIVLEVDGGYHKLNKEYDKERDKFFFNIGIKTIRIKNEKVSYNEILSRLKLNNKNKDIKFIFSQIEKYNKKYGSKYKLILSK